MKSLFPVLLAPILMSPMPAAANSNWTFINYANDNTLYFGRNIRNFEGITFLELKSEDDPEGGDGDENSWIQAFDCKNETIHRSSGGFEPIEEGRVSHGWFEFACNN